MEGDQTFIRVIKGSIEVDDNKINQQPFKKFGCVCN